MAGAFEGVIRRSGLLLTLQVANVGLAYATQVLLARWLGDVQFGVFAYAWAWANLLAVPAGLGLSTAVLRFIPSYAASASSAQLHTLVHWSNRATFAVGSLIGLSCCALWFVTRDSVPAHYLVPLWIAFATVPFLALSTLQINQGNAFGHPAVAYAPWVIGSNVGVLAGAALLVRFNAQLNAARMLSVALIAVLIVVIAQSRAVAKLLGRERRRGHSEARDWLRVSAPLLVSSLLYVLLERADIILVGTLLGPSEAGIYGAAARTALFVSFSSLAVTTIATPRIAPIHASGNRADLQSFATRVGRWTFWPAVLAALALIAFGGVILSLFGPAFRSGWTCLALLAIAQVGPASVGLAPHLLNMTGYQMAGAGAMALAVAVSLALALMLIPRLGITGAALATSTGIVVRAAAHAVLVRRRLGLHTFALLREAGPA